MNDARLVMMDDSNREGVFLHTKEALQLLACAPEVQFRLLAGACVGDELALDFDHWREVMIANFSSELTSEETASLDAIDEVFSRFSRGGSEYREEFWMDEAVRRSPDWECIRKMAREALSRFGWPEEEPSNTPMPD